MKSAFGASGLSGTLGSRRGLLVGFVLVIVGLVLLLGETSTIVMPVIVAAVLGAVAGPAVGWLERHRVPRVGGAVHPNGNKIRQDTSGKTRGRRCRRAGSHPNGMMTWRLRPGSMAGMFGPATREKGAISGRTFSTPSLGRVRS